MFGLHHPACGNSASMYLRDRFEEISRVFFKFNNAKKLILLTVYITGILDMQSLRS